MRLAKRTIGAILLALAATGPAMPQSAPLPVGEAFAPSLSRTEDGIAVRFAIADGYYLYRDNFAATAGGASLAVSTPPGEAKDDPTFGRTEVYHREATVAIAEGVAGAVRLTYQGCQDGGICYRPQTLAFDAETLAVADAGPSLPVWPNGFAPDAPDMAAGGAPASGIRADAAAGGLVTGLVADGGRAMAVAAFFLLGLGLAFTPCVFPMYPILAAQLTRGGARGPMFGLSHSLAYVVAMAAAFGVVGVAAAWSGANLQMALQSPLAIGAVATLFATLALSMFGAFELRLPSGFVNAVARRTPGGGLAGSAALGFTSALIVGPCVTAPLAGALIYIAQTGDAVLGAAALFALGLGQGVPLILFGTVGARVLPRAGGWMTAVTRVFGVVFLALAIFMLSRIVPGPVTLGLGAALAVGVGVALVGRAAASAGWIRQIAATLGVLAVVVGGTLVVGAVAGADDPLRPLAPLTASGAANLGSLDFASAASAVDVARAVGTGERPALVYFTADWCVSCDVIEARVFGDERVRSALSDATLLKVDVTREQPGSAALMDELAVAGPPTILFVSADGAEAPGTRVVGEIDPDAFLARTREAFR